MEMIIGTMIGLTVLGAAYCVYAWQWNRSTDRAFAPFAARGLAVPCAACGCGLEGHRGWCPRLPELTEQAYQDFRRGHAG